MAEPEELGTVDTIKTSESSMPEFVEFLLSPTTPLDLHVTVGDPESDKTLKMGAVKWNLIARSKVFRRMLYESQMKETGEFSITDLEPNTFKNFLTFIYGHDNTSTLSLEDAIKLLNAAEKYDVQELKDKLGQQIKSQVTIDNVFLVLESAALCEQVAPLWKTIKEIIQYSTEGVFSNEQFMDVSGEAMIHILQQEKLSVPEIDVWRAALKWATHQAHLVEETVSSEMLRNILLPVLKHIRFCTLSTDLLSKEVASANILTSEEIGLICESWGKQEKIEN